MSLRDDRAAAVRRWAPLLADDQARALPRLLDALEAVDARHAANGPGTAQESPGGPRTGEETDGSVQAPLDAPRAAARRRTTRREGT